MMNDTRGIYLHFPFCLSKCRYCDFCSFPGSGSQERDAYLEALCREISFAPSEGEEIETVYFGGGTPSLLTPRQLERILDAISRRFRIAQDAEISLEVNPRTADREKLSAFSALGINRISIGMQSLCDRELAALGRIHTSRDAYTVFEDARAAGIGNINLDLMFGIPEQTKRSLAETLRAATELSPEHISAYGLIVEEGTPFFREREELRLPDEDAEYEMYQTVCRMLRDAGYRHYEVSNYAKPGAECRHNLIYWRDRPYFGFGLSAASFLSGVRRVNTRDMAAYLADPLSATQETTAIEGADAEYEYIMLALRLSEGIDEASFCRRFGHSFSESYAERLLPYREAGYLISEGGRTHLTEDGLYISSALLADLLP